eukprot:gene35476-43743_t
MSQTVTLERNGAPLTRMICNENSIAVERASTRLSLRRSNGPISGAVAASCLHSVRLHHAPACRSSPAEMGQTPISVLPPGPDSDTAASIHPAGAGFLPDLRAFVAWAKTRAREPLECSPAFLPFNAPPLPEVKHDRRMVRRYLLQSALRFNAGSLLFLSLAIALLPLWLNSGAAAPGELEPRRLNPFMVSGVVLAVMAWFALMSSGIARGFLARLGEEGKALCAEAMASSVTRRIDAPFNSYTTFDLCTESLSGLALGAALGYSGPPAFFHDPFKGRIVLGRWRPLALGRHVEVRVSSDMGPSCHIELRCRPGLAWFAIQQGESLKAAEIVCVQLRQHLARHANALDAAHRQRELERTSLQARLSALQAQVEPHFLFNTLANLKYLI